MQFIRKFKFFFKPISAVMVILGLFNNKQSSAGIAKQVGYFDTYNGGVILSTDPSGIVFNGIHLIIVDSEINETGPPPPPGYFMGHNIFETNLEGTVNYGEYFTTQPSGSIEPTGICYNPTDGYYYITNDNTFKLYQYEFADTFSLVNSWSLTKTPFDQDGLGIYDSEGIGVNPVTGHMYITDGSLGYLGGKNITTIEVNGNSINRIAGFNIGDRVQDPEGIAFHEYSGHLLIVSGPDMKVFEYDVSGNYIDDYDLSGFQPYPRSPNGLTFAPSSKNNSRLSLFIADRGLDASPERARIYEAELGENITLSAELFYFKAIAMGEMIKLAWKTVVEYEGLTWSIERRSANSEDFLEIARLTVSDSSNLDQVYEYYDHNVLPGEEYFYRLIDIDFNNVKTVHQAVSAKISLPEVYSLTQNFPNPFNQSTVINFDIPETEIDQVFVNLTIYNLLGQKVITLISDYLTPNSYQISWNGVNTNGTKVSSGAYICILQTENFLAARKMILLR